MKITVDATSAGEVLKTTMSCACTLGSSKAARVLKFVTGHTGRSKRFANKSHHFIIIIIISFVISGGSSIGHPPRGQKPNDFFKVFFAPSKTNLQFFF